MNIHYLIGLVDWRGFLIAAVIFLPLERLLPARRDQPVLRRGWTADIGYVLFNALFVRLGLLLLLAGLMFLAKWLVPAGWSAAIARQAVWLQCIEAIVIGDFCLYWTHRALHTNRFLWRFHSVHHAIEDVDWVAAYHSHPVDELMLNGAALGSVYVLGFSPIAISVYVVIFGWAAFASHANTRLTIGLLRWLCVSPEFHRWHHSNDVRDRNFSSVLAIWDVMFGTAHLPRGYAPEVYGIDDEVPAGYADQLLYPFRGIAPEPREAVSTAPQ